MRSLDKIYEAALAQCSATFSTSMLMARAEQATGLADWGDPGWSEHRFRKRLDALCRGLEGDAQLHDRGRSRAHSRLHVLLCSRLRQVAHHGRLVDVPAIVAPMIGTGMPRAGTTFLHGLLACAPGNRIATAAQAAIPIPPPGVGGIDEAERTELYQRILDFQGFTAADLTAVHPYAAAAPEECVFLQEAACGVPLGAFYHAPEFTTIVATAESAADAYAWQLGMMQSLQGWQPTERWLLKAPSHVLNMDRLLATFPDARIFINHRDPGKVIPSMASLYMKLYGLASDSSVDPVALGPRLAANWAGILERLDAWRADHPEVPVADVHYASLIADPIGTAGRLYEQFDLPMTAGARQAMRQHLALDRHGRGPARAYGLAQFGLDEAAIERFFGDYIDRHGIRRERRA